MRQRGRIGDLNLLKRFGSTTRVLNLAALNERYEDDAEFHDKPLFQNKRLNASIILKHTLRDHERDQMQTFVRTATKIIFPFVNGDLDVGGQSIFVEDPNFEVTLPDFLGVPKNDPGIEADIAVLKEIAQLPSIDPYLLRERIRRMGRDVARVYFDISEADAARMHEHVTAEIHRLTSLALAGIDEDDKKLSKRFATLFLEDESSDALEPLRQTLRLTKAEYEEGMFGWKGFLYYQWQRDGFRRQLKPIAEDMMRVKIKKGSSDENNQLNASRERIIKTIGERAKEVDDALDQFNRAFDALVEGGDPGTFRTFLLCAPDMFLETGDHFGALSHVCSFWNFWFPPGTSRNLTAEEAFDVFNEFEASLSGMMSEDLAA